MDESAVLRGVALPKSQGGEPIPIDPYTSHGVAPTITGDFQREALKSVLVVVVGENTHVPHCNHQGSALVVVAAGEST